MNRKSREDLENTIDCLTAENNELKKINQEQAKHIVKLEAALNDFHDIPNIIESGKLRKCDNELCIMCVFCVKEKTGPYTTIMGCKKDISCEDFTPTERFKLNK